MTRAAHGQELILNGSFENTGGTFADSGNGFMSLQPGSTAIPGWTTLLNETAWGQNGGSTGIATPEGSFFMNLGSFNDSPGYGAVFQTVPTAPGQAYLLTLSLGAYQDNPAFGGFMSANATFGSASASCSFNPAGAGNQWQQFSFIFVADGPETDVGIYGTTGSTGGYLGVDNVSLTPVPEPQMAAVVGAAFLAGFSMYRLRAHSARYRAGLSLPALAAND